MRARSAIFIHRPPGVVFDYFADLRNEPDWNRGHVDEVVMTTSGPIGLGTTFEGRHRGFGKAAWRITAFQAPTRIAVEGDVGAGTFAYIGHLSPVDGGTRFEGTIEWRPGGWLWILTPVLAAMLKFQARRSFRHLRAALEAGS